MSAQTGRSGVAKAVSCGRSGGTFARILAEEDAGSDLAPIGSTTSGIVTCPRFDLHFDLASGQTGRNE